MDVAARVTSKGQVTIPRAVREALGLGEGDHVVFRVEGRRAVLARTADLLDLAGAVEVPRPRVAELARAIIAFPAIGVADGSLPLRALDD